MSASHSQWRFVRGYDKTRLMGMASHRSFPGGIAWVADSNIFGAKNIRLMYPYLGHVY